MQRAMWLWCAKPSRLALGVERPHDVLDPRITQLAASLAGEGAARNEPSLESSRAFYWMSWVISADGGAGCK
jgi:hypothetical protein